MPKARSGKNSTGSAQLGIESVAQMGRVRAASFFSAQTDKLKAAPAASSSNGQAQGSVSGSSSSGQGQGGFTLLAQTDKRRAGASGSSSNGQVRGQGSISGSVLTDRFKDKAALASPEQMDKALFAPQVQPGRGRAASESQAQTRKYKEVLVETD